LSRRSEYFRGDTRPTWASKLSVKSEARLAAGLTAYLFRPPQSTTVAEVAVATGSSSPFRCDARVAVGAVLFHLAQPFPPLPLLPPSQQALKLLRQQPILLFHLP
jgi:hypothetical protein